MFLELIVNHGEPAPRLCNKDSLTLHFAVLLSQLFPNAKFLWVVRDPRATVHSIISRQARCLFIIFCIKPQVVVQSQDRLVPNWKRFRQNYVVQTPRPIVKLWELCKPFVDVIRNMNSNATVNDSKLLVYNTTYNHLLFSSYLHFGDFWINFTTRFVLTYVANGLYSLGVMFMFEVVTYIILTVLQRSLCNYYLHTLTLSFSTSSDSSGQVRHGQLLNKSGTVEQLDSADARAVSAVGLKTMPRGAIRATGPDS